MQNLLLVIAVILALLNLHLALRMVRELLRRLLTIPPKGGAPDEIDD